MFISDPFSNRIIDDLYTATVRPEIESFENKAALTVLDKKINNLSIEIENLNSKKGTIEKTIATANEITRNEKQSFDNWVQTRKTLGSPDTDPEVIYRVNRLDEFYKIEQAWRLQLNANQVEIDQREKQQQGIQESIFKEREAAETKYYKELKRYDLKVFLIRLLWEGLLSINITRFNDQKISLGL